MATLGFTTKIKGVDTNFVSKIWKGLIETCISNEGVYFEYVLNSIESEKPKAIEAFPLFSDITDKVAKIHTIRKDVKNRWKTGDKIHMVIFNRSKDRFQFAPVIKVKSIQKIEIKRYLQEEGDIVTSVFIDGTELYTDDVEKLALNDGFNSVEHFFQWFNTDFTGKIIHWTNLIY